MVYLASKARKRDYRPSENIISYNPRAQPFCDEIIMILNGQVKDSKRDKIYLKHSILGVDDALKSYYMV